MNKPHQRLGTISNAHVGAEFEIVARSYFESKGFTLTKNFPLSIGVGEYKKKHHFDLGSNESKIIVECKSHRWTGGDLVPSAKMTTWNEAMFYFHLTPKEYRKILFVLHHRRGTVGETLVAYYKRTYAHLIPSGVEFLEFDEITGEIYCGD